MDGSLSAYFLCAGYGSRLRPLTDRLPKTAIPFQGLSALEINYRLSRRVMPGRTICNVHHLWEIMERLAWRMGMDVLYEKEILGTGGCLHNARHILETTDSFMVHNADLIHTIDLVELLAAHRASGNIATLAGLFRSSHNTLGVDQNGRLLGVHGYSPVDSQREMTRLTFAGIAFYRKEFLKYVAMGAHDIKLDWQSALQNGETIGVVNCSHDADWFDFGTPQGLWEASRFVMDRSGQFSYQYHPVMAEARPYVSNEAGQEGLPEHLRNVVLLEETQRPVSESTHDCILGRNFRWNIQP